jgi:hypothetical protein
VEGSSGDTVRVWEGGPVPPGADAITFGSLVIVRRGERTTALMLHELVHVRQYREHGWIGFLVRYVGWYVLWRMRRKGHQGAYLRIPFEIEAAWEARLQTD